MVLQYDLPNDLPNKVIRERVKLEHTKHKSFTDQDTTLWEDLWSAYRRTDCHLSHSEITRLGEHKYSALDCSILDELVFKKFWTWLIEFFPMNLAPNTITLVGLIINLITVSILSIFCYTATEVAPWWAYFLAAVGLFLYQTLDALDGKQARRTNSSSPLGELFDHGCDSMTQVFVTLNICYALQLGDISNIVVIVNISAVVVFYAAHWTTYCTGTMKFNKFDVTEAQWIVITVLLLTSGFGPGIWSFKLFGIPLKYFTVAGSLGACSFQFIGCIKSIFTEGIGKNGSTIAGTSVIFPLFPLLAVILPFSIIYIKSTFDTFDNHITLFCLCLGATGAKATNRLVIAHMSKSELGIWDWIYIGPLLIVLNQYFGNYFDEFKVLLLATIYVYASLLFFCVMICKQFCLYLNIYCFTLGTRTVGSDSKSSDYHTITKKQ
uniref:Choline/ethanolaminephosphotransferase 1-like n=1 Tax=Rhabditophanes sp. KR3021 TaxID=114890 RepID=A0AC35U893_9BILA